MVWSECDNKRAHRLALLLETHRVLRPQGRAVFSFSNRMFRSKVVEIWRDADDATRLWVVAAYFRYSGAEWQDITVLDLSARPGSGGDPLFVVQATKGDGQL